MSATARFELPLLNAGQAQKELSHNEALTRIDALIQPCVEAVGVNVPPADPEPGACWIVGASPELAWIGQADALAMWTESGWRFVAPNDGMTVWVRDDALAARYGVDGWDVGSVAASRLAIAGQQVVGSREAAIPTPGGGAVIDVEARAAVAAILTAMRTHGLIAST